MANMVDELTVTFIVNVGKSKKFHRKGCPCVDNMSERHRKHVVASDSEKTKLIGEKFVPCKICKP